MMIAIVRNNLAFLISKNNPFVCKSHASFALSPLFFSTRSEKQTVTCPKVYDLLLHKHHFSPELASLVASGSKSPEKADSVLSFLKDSGCSTTQMQKIVKYDPRILRQRLDDVKFKIKIFQDLGLSPDDIAKMISSSPVILHLSAKSNIIPSLSLLKGLLGSDFDVARLLRISGWPISADLGNTLLPNVEFLKSFGVPMERILFYLYSSPRSLLIKPNLVRKSAEKAKEMGFGESKKSFIYAVRTISSMKEGMWEAKMQSLKNTGFSEMDILTMFKTFPLFLCASTEKLEKINQLLLATGKFDMSCIVKYPALFSCSIEKRLEPRLRVLRILESNNLIKKWPSLKICYSLSNASFFKIYVMPYSDVVGEAYGTKSENR